MYADLESKEEIRRKIAAKHRIAMLVGDDLEDFAESRVVYAQNQATLAPLWGKRWFIIPNPAYGSWPQAITAGVEQQISEACDPLETKEQRESCAYGMRYETGMQKLKAWLPLE
jgi:acid phosphatase